MFSRFFRYLFETEEQKAAEQMYVELEALIESFRPAFAEWRMDELHEYLQHGEPALALDLLSAWIYEADIAVSNAQEQAFVELSPKLGVALEQHKFIGRTPPYPDLREQTE